MIKLNTDATLFNNSAALVMVARDDRGCVLKVWSKVEPISDPLIAEAAAAMYWVLQQVKVENYSKICIDGDAKLCIDALNGSMTNVWWKIDTFCGIGIGGSVHNRLHIGSTTLLALHGGFSRRQPFLLLLLLLLLSLPM
uniref:RNase H type-1 domain-containing protein n=1 Tax=Fagus sylvatica TaxID=28930 RepID=A0A2N9J6B7_FAGSY